TCRLHGQFGLRIHRRHLEQRESLSGYREDCLSASTARCRYTLRAASNCSSTCSRSFGERQDAGLSAIFHSLSSQVRKYSAEARLLIFCSPTYTRTGFETACGKDGSEERAFRCPSAV